MHARKRGLLLAHLIIIISLSLLLLAGESMLTPLIPESILRWCILTVLAAILYYFMAPSILQPFLETDAKLKEMIDHTLHELNTPIATIEANISMLKRSLNDAKAQKRLERISEAATNLTRLCESIEYNIKENIEHIEKSHFDLHALIERSIRKFDETRGDISIVNESEHFHLLSDKNGFERTIDNLLSNAIKYNRPGGYVKFYTREKRLFIEDSGIGIDPKNLFIVYEKSFQENPTTEGFGLGLSIVKNFCDREKIAIKINTQKDTGTTISLDLRHLQY